MQTTQAQPTDAHKPFLSHEIRAAIEAYYPRYPTRRAVVLPALHVVNERLGYVPLEAVVEIAEMLGLAPAQVQDTLSFYDFFPQDKPQGRFKVWVCRSISCSCCEGEELLDYLAEKLGIQPGETTADGRVTLAARRMSRGLRLRPGHAGERHAVQEHDQREDRCLRGDGRPKQMTSHCNDQSQP